MPLPVPSLSGVCRSIADFLSQELQASQNNILVLIGRPSDAEPGQGDHDHRVNLFFYRFEPGEFGPAPAPDEPWLLRTHCLITAFGVSENQVSPGENDLRLLGEVIRVFHERPVLDPVEVDGQEVRTRVVLQPLGVDEINHLWSTQGEVTYRPSVAYEMALAPVVPSRSPVGSPLTGATGLDVRTAARRTLPFAGTPSPPRVPFTRVETGREDWAPRICFVQDEACAETVAMELGSPVLAAFVPRVWVAGEPGAGVDLAWEIWDRSEGWRRVEPTVPATATDPAIDPDEAGTATTTSLTLPFDDHAGQAVLHAVRSYTRARDGAQLTVRSNPLLVTLYEGAP